MNIIDPHRDNSIQSLSTEAPRTQEEWLLALERNIPATLQLLGKVSEEINRTDALLERSVELLNKSSKEQAQLNGSLTESAQQLEKINQAIQSAKQWLWTALWVVIR